MRLVSVTLVLVLLAGCGMLESESNTEIRVDIEPEKPVFSLKEDLAVSIRNRSEDTVFVNFDTCPPLLQKRVVGRWVDVSFTNIACTLELRLPTPVAPDESFSAVIISQFLLAETSVSEGTYRLPLRVSRTQRLVDGSDVQIEELHVSDSFRLVRD